MNTDMSRYHSPYPISRNDKNYKNRNRKIVMSFLTRFFVSSQRNFHLIFLYTYFFSLLSAAFLKTLETFFFSSLSVI